MVAIHHGGVGDGVLPRGDISANERTLSLVCRGKKRLAVSACSVWNELSLPNCLAEETLCMWTEWSTSGSHESHVSSPKRRRRLEIALKSPSHRARTPRLASPSPLDALLVAPTTLLHSIRRRKDGWIGSKQTAREATEHLRSQKGHSQAQT